MKIFFLFLIWKLYNESEIIRFYSVKQIQIDQIQG